MSENEIREAFRDEIGAEIGEEPPIAGGPAAVFAGARARAVRDRAVAGALSVVAVLGIAGGVMAFGDGGGNSGASTVSPGVAEVQASRVPIGGRSAAEFLKLELPAGLTTGSYSGADSNTNIGSAVYGAMAVNDGTGKLTLISATVWRRPNAAISAQACDNIDHRELSGISGCQGRMEPDGSVLLVYRVDDKHQDAHGRPLDAYHLVAEHLFPNGVDVLIAASNWFAPFSDPSVPATMVGPSRQTPVLSQDQLQAMVMDPRWGLTVPADFAQQAERDITPYVDMIRKG